MYSTLLVVQRYLYLAPNFTVMMLNLELQIHLYILGSSGSLIRPTTAWDDD